jgi:branched-chain amino acid transport system permease protein
MNDLLIQGALSGLLIGGVYGLIALGLNLVFGTMRVVNFAQGSLLMVAMFMTYWLHVLTGLHPYLTPLVTVPVLFGVGYAIQLVLITPLLAREKAREPMSVLLMTLGLALLLENLALLLFRGDYKTVQVSQTNAVWFVGDYIVSVSRFWALVALLATVAALWAFLSRTDLGRAIRAVGQDRQVARLLGINDRVIYNYAFGISTAVMGIAAATLVPFYYIHPGLRHCRPRRARQHARRRAGRTRRWRDRGCHRDMDAGGDGPDPALRRVHRDAVLPSRRPARG